MTTKPAVLLHPSGTVVSFDGLDAAANRLAHFLGRAGLAAGDTVAVLMENNEHIHAAMWAARRSGLYYTMVNTHLSVTEIAYIVADSGATAFISSHAMREICVGLNEVLGGGMPSIALIADGCLKGWQSYPECVQTEPASRVVSERDGQLLQYSAGST